METVCERSRGEKLVQYKTYYSKTSILNTNFELLEEYLRELECERSEKQIEVRNIFQLC